MARARRKRGRTRGEPSGLLIGALGVVAVGLIGGLVWLYVTALGNTPERDASLCPKAGPTSQTLVLVDASDAIADLTKTEIAQRLADEAASVPTGGRLTIRTLRTDTPRTEQIFDLCNPGDGSDLNAITGNPERARARWMQGFAAPLSTALRQATVAAPSKTSPLMAAIQQFAVDRLVARTSHTISTKLIIISDMLENTPDFSMYRQGADYAAFVASPAAAKYDTNLAGADVELWLVARANAPADANALTGFWTRWTSRANGSTSRALRLQGVSNG